MLVHSKSDIIPLVVLGVGIAAVLLLAFLPLRIVLAEFLSDDAFYYFKIAQNIVLGNGPSFDGITTTNGFHPLWLGLLALMTWLLGAVDVGSEALIRSALWAGALLFTGTSVLLFVFLKRLAVTGAARAAALAVWTLNPVVWYAALNGLETMLALFLLIAALLAAHQLPKNPSRTTLVYFGVLLGFVILARLDFVFLVVGFLLWQVFSADAFRTGVIRAVTTGLAITAIVLPYVLLSADFGGSVIPSSGQATTFVQKTLIFGHDSLLTTIAAFSGFVHTAFSLLFTVFAAPLVIAVVLGIGIVFVKTETCKQARHVPLAYVLGGAIILALFNIFIRVLVRDWYFIPLVLLVSVLVGLILMEYQRRRNSLVPLFVLLAFIPFFAATWLFTLYEREVTNLERVAAIEWTNSTLPDGTILGSFNSGALGYYSAHPVINLDGLVNPRALEALQTHTMGEYIKEAGITHIIDYDVYPTYRYASFWGDTFSYSNLHVLERFYVTIHSRSDSGLFLYEVTHTP